MQGLKFSVCGVLAARQLPAPKILAVGKFYFCRIFFWFKNAEFRAKIPTLVGNLGTKLISAKLRVKY